jgi:hypothetical protein
MVLKSKKLIFLPSIWFFRWFLKTSVLCVIDDCLWLSHMDELVDQLSAFCLYCVHLSTRSELILENTIYIKICANLYGFLPFYLSLEIVWKTINRINTNRQILIKSPFCQLENASGRVREVVIETIKTWTIWSIVWTHSQHMLTKHNKTFLLWLNCTFLIPICTF